VSNFPQSRELEQLLKTEELLLTCKGSLDEKLEDMFNFGGELHFSQMKDALLQFYQRNSSRFDQDVLKSYIK
jgi:hypothetical protein